MVKKMGFLIALTIVASSVAAQNVKDTHVNNVEPIGLIEYESMPIFKGDLLEFIKNHINYPPSALRDSIQGRIFVSFYVDTLGNTIEHNVINEIRDDLNQEALRVTRLIKFEKAAMQNGKPAKVKYTLPVDFIFSNTKRK